MAIATPATNQITVGVFDRSGTVAMEMDLDPTQHTPKDIIDHLLAERKIMAQMPDGGQLIYQVQKNGQELPIDQPLGASGVVDGDRLLVQGTMVKG